MQNFDYMTPTRLIFGEGVIAKLTEVLKPLGNKVLLTYAAEALRKWDSMIK